MSWAVSGLIAAALVLGWASRGCSKIRTDFTVAHHPLVAAVGTVTLPSIQPDINLS